MSLDDLITLLLVILFVGAPLLRRFLGRGGSQPGPERQDRGDGEAKPGGQPAEGRGQPSAEPSQPARADREATTASREPGRPESDFERKLAEARRRVQEARGDAGGRGAGADGGRDPRQAGGRSRQAPDRRVWEVPAPPLVQARTEAPKAFLGREGVREPRPKSAPLEVSKRSRRRAGSRLSARDVVSVKRHDILQGIVWHQILSDPVSKRAPRRKPSRAP